MVSVALPCIAEPTTYAGTVECPLYCGTGEPSFVPELAQDVPGATAVCGSGLGDAVCLIRCAGTEPRVEVLPEPGLGALVLGVLVLSLVAAATLSGEP